MKFKDKKEYYSLRKFKGVGLASAVVGLTFLAPSVMAEETATTNVSGSDIISVKPIDDKSTVAEDAPKILEQNRQPTVSASNLDSKEVKHENIVSIGTVVDTPKADVLETKVEEVKALVSENNTNSDVSVVDSEKPTRSRRGRRALTDESPYVSDKAKEVVRELNDTLVMKKEDTASTSDTLFKLDEGLKVTEEEKAYVKAVTDAFNDMPELVRSGVHSLTFVRKPNGNYGYTYSESGDVNMNMQYYHPELTHGEPGSLQQSVEVLGHEVGHIFNAKSFRDNKEWSFSRDPKYAELAKEVYGDSMTDNIHGRWASDFGSYVAWVSGKKTPQNDGERKIYAYMDSLFKGILTPREDRITPELKQAVEAAKAGGKRLVYDGHVSLDATYKDVDSVQSHVDELNRTEAAKVAGISDAGHFKTYGINKLVTTRYTVDDADLLETVVAKNEAPQRERAGYDFVTKEVSHGGLLVNYKYRANTTNDLNNDVIAAGLSLETITGENGNRGVLHFELKKDVSDLNVNMRIYNLSTGRFQNIWQSLTESDIQSQKLKGQSLNGGRYSLGNTNKGYTASTDFTYNLKNGTLGDNVYRVETSFYDGSTLLGTVHKDVKASVLAYTEEGLPKERIESQIEGDTIIGGIVKNDTLYTPSYAHIFERSDALKSEITKYMDTYKANHNGNINYNDFLVSRDQLVRVKVLNSDYSFASEDKNMPTKDVSHGGTIRTYDLNWEGWLRTVNGIREKIFNDTRVLLKYNGNNSSPRVDKVPIQIEIYEPSRAVVNSDGSTSMLPERVMWSKTVIDDVHFVNYEEKYSKYFSNTMSFATKIHIDSAKKINDGFNVENEYNYYVNRIMHDHYDWRYVRRNPTTETNINESQRGELHERKGDENVVLRTGAFVAANLSDSNLFEEGSYKVRLNKPTNEQFDYSVKQLTLLTTTEGTHTQKIYSVKSDGSRELIRTIKPSKGVAYYHTVKLPTDTTAVEVEVDGVFTNNYRPLFQATWVTDRKVKDLPFRDLNDYSTSVNAPNAFKHTTEFSAGNKSTVLNDYETVVKKTDLGLDNERDPYGFMHRVQSIGDKFRLETNAKLATAGWEPSEVKFDSSLTPKRWMLLPDGISPVSGDYTRHNEKVTIDGVSYNLYYQDVNIKTADQFDSIDTEMVVKPSALKGVRESKVYGYSGYLYKVADGQNVHYSENDMKELNQVEAHDKVANLLGINDANTVDRIGDRFDYGANIQMPNGRFDVTIKAAQESYSFHEGNIVSGSGSLANLVHETVELKTDVVNFQTRSIKNNVIYQELPKGDVNMSFMGVDDNANYTVYYTSDDVVNADSSWSDSKPSKVTGLKWVRKTPLDSNTSDAVSYKVQVNDDAKKHTSVAKSTVLFDGLTSVNNDVVLKTKHGQHNIQVDLVVEDSQGRELRRITRNRKSYDEGTKFATSDLIHSWMYHWEGMPLHEVRSSTLPLQPVKDDATYNEKTLTAVDKDGIDIVELRYRYKSKWELNQRRNYTTTWDENGYVAPSDEKLKTLFPDLTDFKPVASESNQKIKVYNASFNDGSTGKVYVDISIDPVKEPVTEIHKGITYQGDEEKDLGYKETTPGNNHTYTKVKSYTADDAGIFHESVTTENDVPAKDAIVTLGTKPTVNTETIAKGKRYEADPDQAVKGQETVVTPGQDGVKTSTTRYTVNPTTGDITSNTTVENTEKVDTVVKVGNKDVLTESIATTTRYKAEPSFEKDVQETETNGQAGNREITVTYDVNPSDGTLSNPTRTTRETTSMTPTVIKVGSVHKEVVETEITTKYISDDTKVRDSREELVAGSKGVKTTTTIYEVDENTGATHSPTTQIDNQPMVQKVVKIGTKPIVDVETIAITTRYIFDESLAYGQQIVEEKGSEGRVVTTTTYTMNESDGTTSADTPDVQTVPMVQRVIRIGVKPTVEETPINFNTFYEPDPTVDKDSRVDKVVGKAGKITTTTTYTYDSNTGVVTPNPSTSQKEDAVDRIVKVGTRPNVVETPIDFTTTYEADPESQRDSKVDKVVGKNGTTTVTTTYSVDPKTGVVTENPSITTVKDPVNAVIKVGTKSTEVVETLPSPKRFVKDPTRPKDEEPLTENGRTGSKTTITTHTVNPKTGVTIPNEQPPVIVDPTDTIVRVPAGDRVVEEKIAITTRYIEDPTKDFGYEEEISKGSEGKIVTTTTYNVDGQTGDVTEGGTNQVRTDMVQRVVRKGTKPKVVETPIHFTTRYEKDGTKPKGENTDFVNGVPGKTITTTTYTLDPNNGNVTENPSTSTTEEPVTKVVKIGAKDTIEVTPIELVTRYERDDDLMVGKSTIVNAGKAGSITTTTTYDVNPTTGDVIESGKTSITDDMVEKVVKVGTKPSVSVDTRPINVRYVPKEDIDYGVRTVKSEGSSTVITSTTNYVLNPDGSTTASTPVVTTVDGSDRVIEVGVKTSSVTIELPYDVETKYDSNLEAGQTVVDQNGENGSKTIVTTYSLNETTGDVTSNTNETSVQPKPKKVRIGTGVRSTNVRHIIHNIQFETETIVDRFLPKGKEVVENEGTLGKDIETIVEQLFNGEVRTSDSSTQRVLDPVKRVVRIGIYEFAKPIENLTIEPEEFNGGVNPNDAPVVEIPEFNGGVTPNEAPIAEKPDYEGGVVPNDAPIAEKPEYRAPVFIPNLNDDQSMFDVMRNDSYKEYMLPNTGESDSNALSLLGGLSLMSILGLASRKRKED